MIAALVAAMVFLGSGPAGSPVTERAFLHDACARFGGFKVANLDPSRDAMYAPAVPKSVLVESVSVDESRDDEQIGHLRSGQFRPIFNVVSLNFNGSAIFRNFPRPHDLVLWLFQPRVLGRPVHFNVGLLDFFDVPCAGSGN